MTTAVKTLFPLFYGKDIEPHEWQPYMWNGLSKNLAKPNTTPPVGSFINEVKNEVRNAEKPNTTPPVGSFINEVRNGVRNAEKPNITPPVGSFINEVRNRVRNAEKPNTTPPVGSFINEVRNRVRNAEKPNTTPPVGSFINEVRNGVRNEVRNGVKNVLHRISPLGFLSERPFRTINEEMDEQWKIANHYEGSSVKRKAWKGGRHRVFQVDVEEIMTDLLSVDVSRYREKRPSCFGEITFHLAVCIAYADYYQICLYVLNPFKKTYVVFGDKEKTKVVLEYDVGTNLFSLMEDGLPTDISSWLEMEDYRRPLKALTHYKKEELEMWVNRLLPVGSVRKNYSKQEMHKMLQHYCWGVGSLEAGPTQTLNLI